MSHSVSFAALRARVERDRVVEGNGAQDLVEARLDQALDAIGWRSAGGLSSDEVAAVAVHILDACVTGHHDVDVATQALADLLYSSAATLDGSMSAASAFLPAAEEVLHRYVRGT